LKGTLNLLAAPSAILAVLSITMPSCISAVSSSATSLTILTSAAGTTIAGIYELERGALRTSMMNAVEAATMAAEKVAKKFEGDA